MFNHMFLINCKTMKEIHKHPDSDLNLQAKVIICCLLLREAVLLQLWLLSVKFLVCRAIYWHICNQKLYISYTFSNMLTFLRAKLETWGRGVKLCFIHFLLKGLNWVKIMKSVLECPDEHQNKRIGIIKKNNVRGSWDVLPTFCVYPIYELLSAAAASLIP